MVRFLHTADWQLGMTRHFLHGEAQARYSAARIDAIRAIGVVAGEQACEFVLVCGDVFESNQVSSRTVRRALEAMCDIPVPVYLLPGNHDPLDAASVYTSAVFRQARPAHVQVLDEPGPAPVRDGVEVVAAPWFTKRPDTDLVACALEGLVADGTVRILAGHGCVDALSPDPAMRGVIALERVEHAVASGAIHYAALGDRHSRLTLGERGHVHYPGSPEVTSFRDERPGEVLVVDVEGASPVVQEHHVGTWQFRSLRQDLRSSADIEALDAELEAIRAKHRTVVRHALTGALGLSDITLLEDVLDRHADCLAALFEWEPREVVVTADPTDLRDLELSGFVARAAEELRAAAVGEVGSRAAGEALSLLHRLARASAS